MNEEYDNIVRMRKIFPSHIGITVQCSSRGKARLLLSQKEENTNAVHTIHGGAIAGLIDVAVTEAARSKSSDITRVLTISMSISYLNPATGDITAAAEVISSSKRLATVKADVFSSDGILLTTSLAHLRLLREAS